MHTIEDKRTRCSSARSSHWKRLPVPAVRGTFCSHFLRGPVAGAFMGQLRRGIDADEEQLCHRNEHRCGCPIVLSILRHVRICAAWRGVGADARDDGRRHREERERRTIEYLFASTLTGSEIIFSKFLARTLHVAAQLAVGLPILALGMMLGGIQPTLLVAVFAVTFATLLATAALSIATSVWSSAAATPSYGRICSCWCS